MSTFSQVDPESFIDTVAKTPKFGRGAWTKSGIGFSALYMLAPDGEKRIGTVAQLGLAHWAVAAGALGIQRELKALGLYAGALDGIFGPATKAAVEAFQKSKGLIVDGEFGRASAKALFTPLIDAAEAAENIPSHFLRGMINSESALDPGAVGYYIYYGASLSYRGVDRGPGQINSKAQSQVSWVDAFNFKFAAKWTAERLRKTYDSLESWYPNTDSDDLWDAAICSHNNPFAGNLWARDGVPPTEAAAESGTEARRS